MFIERLNELLAERQLTSSKMLSDLKMGKNQYSYWKKTGAIPNVATVQVIANYFGVTVDYLLGNDDLVKQALDIVNDQSLSDQEKAIIAMFRYASEEGKLRIIQAIMNICDETEKNSSGEDSAKVV